MNNPSSNTESFASTHERRKPFSPFTLSPPAYLASSCIENNVLTTLYTTDATQENAQAHNSKGPVITKDLPEAESREELNKRKQELNAENA